MNELNVKNQIKTNKKQHLNLNLRSTFPQTSFVNQL